MPSTGRMFPLTEEGKDLATFDAKANVIDGNILPKCLGDVKYTQPIICCGLNSSSLVDYLLFHLLLFFAVCLAESLSTEGIPFHAAVPPHEEAK